MSKKYNELDEFEKIDCIGKNATEVAASIATTLSVFSLITLLTGYNEHANYLPVLTGATLLISPLTYIGFKQIQKKLKERMKRDAHMSAQLFTMLDEAFDSDRKITSRTSFFVQEILDVFEENNKDFPQDEIMHINQFIYMINANYFDEINRQFPSLDREDIIRKLIEQISNYLNASQRMKFDETDAKTVLEYCLFIKPDMKEQMFKEFKKSKVKFKGTYNFEIIRKDTETVSEYIEKFDEERKATWFDVDNVEDYDSIISNFESQDYWQEEGLPSPENLIWDMAFLMIIVKTIVKHNRSELRKQNEEYTNLSLAADYIYNAMLYAVLNNKKEVGKTELLNTFKNWNYLPFEMKLDTINIIFNENEISYDEHPLGIKSTRSKKQPQKIIKFPTKGIHESE